MNRLSSICKHNGCNELVPAPGYCKEHISEGIKKKRQSWADADAKKSPEAKAFYSDPRWTKTSKRHRKQEPLCRQCKKEGWITKGQMVHHEPSREKLIEMGENPFADRYLVTLCNSCHNKIEKGK